MCFPAVKFVGDGFANSTDYNKSVPIFHDLEDQINYDEAERNRIEAEKHYRVERETENVVSSAYVIDSSTIQELRNKPKNQGCKTSKEKKTCKKT